MPRRLQQLLRVLGRIAFALVFLWVIGAVWFSGIAPGPVPQILALCVALGFPIAWYRCSDRKRVILAFAGFAVLVAAAWQFKRPSNDRDWTADMQRVAAVTIRDDQVSIEGLRDCRYRGADDFDVGYLDRVFDLSALRTLDFLVERFHVYDGLAHTLLSFGFEDGQRVVISIELRREVGERFDPIAGLFKQFELMYVVGTERDLIALRTNHRRSRVWLYPIRATTERLRALFLDMLARVQLLSEEPAFYNTLTSNCTTNIVDHVRTLVPDGVPLDWRVLLPGFSGELAYDLELIDTELPFPAAQAHFRIDALAQEGPVGPDFSERIRSRR